MTHEDVKLFAAEYFSPNVEYVSRAFSSVGEGNATGSMSLIAKLVALKNECVIDASIVVTGSDDIAEHLFFEWRAIKQVCQDGIIFYFA